MKYSMLRRSVWLMLGATLSLMLSCRREDTPRVPLLDMRMAKPYDYSREWTEGVKLNVPGRTLTVDVRGRGHSTFRQPKHPYNYRLVQPMSMLGMPVHTEWVLLANFFDHSLMRNALGLEVARQTSLAGTTPQCRFVWLRVNGSDEGLYLLCEPVKQMTADQIVKFDVYDGEKELTRSFAKVEGLRIDTLSMIDWWLVQELCMNAEPQGPRSCYMHITWDRKVMAGPVWDFDLSFNSVAIDDGRDLRPVRFMDPNLRPKFLEGRKLWSLNVDSFYSCQALFYPRLLQDEVFLQRARERWLFLQPRFASLTQYIDSLDRLIAPYAHLDQARWNEQDRARFDTCTTYEAGVQALKSLYVSRLSSLDSLLALP